MVDRRAINCRPALASIGSALSTDAAAFWDGDNSCLGFMAAQRHFSVFPRQGQSGHVPFAHTTSSDAGGFAVGLYSDRVFLPGSWHTAQAQFEGSF